MDVFTDQSGVAFTVRQDFRNRIPQLSAEEAGQLDENLRNQGCFDALKLWKAPDGSLVLLDGHNRLDVCLKHKIPFNTVQIELPDEEAALDWIDRNAVGQRNLSPCDRQLVVGRIYNRKKRKAGAPAGNTNASKQRDQIEPVVSTAEAVGEEVGVSPAAVKRYGKRAEVHDTLVAGGYDKAAQVAKTAPEKLIAEAAKQPAIDQKAKTLSARPVSQESNVEAQLQQQFEAAYKLLGKLEDTFHDLRELSKKSVGEQESMGEQKWKWWSDSKTCTESADRMGKCLETWQSTLGIKTKYD